MIAEQIFEQIRQRLKSNQRGEFYQKWLKTNQIRSIAAGITDTKRRYCGLGIGEWEPLNER